MHINIYVYNNANPLVKKYFKVKRGISKLALRGTQTKAISPVQVRPTKLLSSQPGLVTPLI